MNIYSETTRRYIPEGSNLNTKPVSVTNIQRISVWRGAKLLAYPGRPRLGPALTQVQVLYTFFAGAQGLSARSVQLAWAVSRWLLIAEVSLLARQLHYARADEPMAHMPKAAHEKIF
jgi:hypothetical protein